MKVFCHLTTKPNTLENELSINATLLDQACSPALLGTLALILRSRANQASYFEICPVLHSPHSPLTSTPSLSALHLRRQNLRHPRPHHLPHPPVALFLQMQAIVPDLFSLLYIHGEVWDRGTEIADVEARGRVCGDEVIEVLAAGHEGGEVRGAFGDGEGENFGVWGGGQGEGVEGFYGEEGGGGQMGWWSGSRM